MSKSKKKVCSGDHPDHTKELARLKKIAGQVAGIQRMIEDQRYCIDIMQQLSAVKSAVVAVQSNMLETHLNACVTDVIKTKKDKDVKKKISELKLFFSKG